MFINLAVASLSRYLGSQPFLNLTIDQYLYGYPDPLISLANDYIPNWIDFAQFGVLDRVGLFLDFHYKNLNNVLLQIFAVDGFG